MINFKVIDENLVNKIRTLSDDKLNRIIEDILDIENLDDAIKYL